MLYNVMLTRSSAVAVTADRTAYIWYSSRPLSRITVVACVFTYLQFQTEGCFWCLPASDHCVSCELLCWVLIFATLCGKTIHPTAKVSEEVNRKYPARNTMVQLSTPCTDPECQNAQHYRETGDSIMSNANQTARRYNWQKFQQSEFDKIKKA